MKGRETIIITIGAMVALLVAVMLMQFRTVEETDITTLEAMRETELRAEVASWKEKYEETTKQLAETKEKINEYYATMESNDKALELLKEELEQDYMRVGKADVKGEGIIITLSDSTIAQIDDYDIYKLINELRLAGAEAISVNDIRITALTDVKSIAPGWIRIDGKNLNSPYVVKAIGDETYLESALTRKTYGYIDYVIKSFDKNAKLEKTTEGEVIQIPSTTKTMKLEYAEEAEK